MIEVWFGLKGVCWNQRALISTTRLLYEITSSLNFALDIFFASVIWKHLRVLQGIVIRLMFRALRIWSRGREGNVHLKDSRLYGFMAAEASVAL